MIKINKSDSSKVTRLKRKVSKGLTDIEKMINKLPNGGDFQQNIKAIKDITKRIV